MLLNVSNKVYDIIVYIVVQQIFSHSKIICWFQTSNWIPNIHMEKCLCTFLVKSMKTSSFESTLYLCLLYITQWEEKEDRLNEDSYIFSPNVIYKCNRITSSGKRSILWQIHSNARGRENSPALFLCLLAYVYLISC